jgi:molybdopterin-guanine dinucleotide biosynthesis protein
MQDFSTLLRRLAEAELDFVIIGGFAASAGNPADLRIRHSDFVLRICAAPPR